MLEADAGQVEEEILEQGIKFGLKHTKQIEDFLQGIIKRVGKPKIEIDFSEDEEIKKMAKKIIPGIAKKILFAKPLPTKKERLGAFKKIGQEVEKKLIEEKIGKKKREKIIAKTDIVVHQQVSQAIIDQEKRIDGRKLDQIRSLSAKVGILPRVHGSSIFNRGETQSLSVVTLGAPGMEQYLDTMEQSGRKRFMHHYNFPPFCSGETKSLRSTSRREVGHGYLAEKGLKAVLPDQTVFPYTIRLVTEILSSNGSTSMAAVCASSLSMMDAGIPISSPVAGIAIGLASQEDEQGFKKYKVFTDLQDLEDGQGGMDFKVVGTVKGITAIQMDTKTFGLTLPIIHDAFVQAKKARQDVLSIMNKVLDKPRPDLSSYAPQIEVINIDPEKIRALIGPGGRHIKEITEKTEADIDVEQTGKVAITANSKEELAEAVKMVKAITQELKAGDIFKAEITRIVDFGAFAKIAPGREGLIHVSELAKHYVKNPREVVKIGDVIPVKVIEVDRQGRINFSAKDVPSF